MRQRPEHAAHCCGGGEADTGQQSPAGDEHHADAERDTGGVQGGYCSQCAAKLEELKVKVEGAVEPSVMERLDEIIGCKVMYSDIEEKLKDHDRKQICVYCDHLEGMLETGLVKGG